MKPKKPKSRSFSANKHASAGAHSSCHEPADGAKKAALDAGLRSAREPMARSQSATSNARTQLIFLVFTVISTVTLKQYL